MPVEAPVVEDDDDEQRREAAEDGDHLERAGAPARSQAACARSQRHHRAADDAPEREAAQRRDRVRERSRDEGFDVPPVVGHHPLDERLEGEAERDRGGEALRDVGLAGAAGIREREVDDEREAGEREQDRPPRAERSTAGEGEEAEAQQRASGDARGVRGGERGEAGDDGARTRGAAIAGAERVAEVREREQREAQAERVLPDHDAELVRVDVGEREGQRDARGGATRAGERDEEAVGAEEEDAQIERADGHQRERVGQRHARELEQRVEERGHALDAHRFEERAPRHGARLQHGVGLVAPELVPAEVEEGDGEDGDGEGSGPPRHRSPARAGEHHRAPKTSTSLSTRWLGCATFT